MHCFQKDICDPTFTRIISGQDLCLLGITFSQEQTCLDENNQRKNCELDDCVNSGCFELDACNSTFNGLISGASQCGNQNLVVPFEQRCFRDGFEQIPCTLEICRLLQCERRNNFQICSQNFEDIVLINSQCQELGPVQPEQLCFVGDAQVDCEMSDCIVKNCL